MPEESPRGPRPFWSGTIVFGLVGIPVTLFGANRPGRISLRMVDENGTPLRRRFFAAGRERALGDDDVVRGYEIEKGRFVVVEDDELDRLAPEKSREIDLRRFVPLSEIDPIYFERAYFLAPERGAGKAYRLLAKTMEEQGRAGIATFVLRGKESLVAILAENGLLRAETLRFHDEVRTPEEVGLPEAGQAETRRVRAIEKAIAELEADELDREWLADSRRPRLLELARRKLESGEDVVAAPPETEPDASEGGEVIDLMQALKRSLREGSSRRGPKARPSRSRAKAQRTSKAGSSGARRTSSSKRKAR